MLEKSDNTTLNQLTLFAEDFHVKTLALQERGQGLRESAQPCGENTPVLFASLDPAGLWLKMSGDYFQVTVDNSLLTFSETWPSAGTMRSGMCYRQQPLVLRTSGKEYLSWVWIQTPRASSTVPSLEFGAFGKIKRMKTPEEFALMEMFPTPTSRDWRSGKASLATMERNSRPLSEAIGGSLNPPWVEWLMGFPTGWTDLEA